MTKSKTQWSTWEDMPLDEFQKRVGKAKAAAATFTETIADLFPGLITLTAAARKAAPRLRDGEYEALGGILAVADAKPALVEALADEDGGSDPEKFETALLRERIEKHQQLGELSASLEPLSGELNDTVLYLASRFHLVLYAAYRLERPLADKDTTIHSLLAKTIDFMRKNAVAAAATRAKKKSPPPTT